MLKLLRQKKVMKKILWALAIIIIPAFVLWGATGLRERGNYAGMIFGKKISFDEYRASLNAVKNLAILRYGSEFSEKRDELNLEQEAWENLIMLKEAKQKKITATDKEVVTRIASFVFFQGKDGSFSPQAYDTILSNAFRTSPRQFEEEMRRSIMIEKLVQGVMSDVPQPTDEDIEKALENELNREKEEKEKEKEKAKEDKKDKKKKKKKNKEDKEEEKEETLDERKERVKQGLIRGKSFMTFQNWRSDLYGRANFVNFLIEEPKEVPEEETEPMPTPGEVSN